MKIDITKIEGYEEMTAEEKVQVLETFEVEDEKAKKNIARANGEAADWKRKYKALEEEREGEKSATDVVLESLKREVDQLKREKKESEHKANFLSLGYGEELATKSAKALIEGDLTKFFEFQKEFQKDYKKSIEKEALFNMTTPMGGGSNNKYDNLTGDEFKSLSYAKRVKLKKEQPEIYKKFTK